MDDAPDPVAIDEAGDMPGINPEIDYESPVVAKQARAQPTAAKSKPSLIEALQRNAEKSRAMFGGIPPKIMREEATV